MIISGGVNIYPREIEDVLVVHPAVADVGVLGTPDPDMGEQVTAFVQLADGASATEAELIEWCRERLSHFKCPREVRFVDDAPPAPHRQAPQAPPRLTTSVAGSAPHADAEVVTDRGRLPRRSRRAGVRRSASNSAMPGPTAASLSSVNLGKPASRSASHSSAKAPLLDAVDDLAHRAGHVEVGELGDAAELAVLARRRVVLHLGGVALEAQQPVGALHLAATGTAR